jgi:hypothetical protein
MDAEGAIRNAVVGVIAAEIAHWSQSDLAQLHALTQAANALQGRRQQGWNLLDFAVEVLLPALGAA